MIDPGAGAHRDLLRRSVQELARRTRCPIAFGGLTSGGLTPLDTFVGTRGASLTGLRIEPTHGVGGLAASDRRPIAAVHYRRSPTITHRYDREVSAEGIVSLLAVPVVVEGQVHAVLYGGHREPVQFGDAVIREAVATAKSLEWEYSVTSEVDRRLAALDSDGRVGPRLYESQADRSEFREVFALLREIGRTVTDPALAERIETVARRVMPVTAPPTAPALSPRELDMLAQVGLGKRNAHIAAQLGLSESTVKSYVASAMRKLDASSRYEAVVIARRKGLLP